MNGFPITLKVQNMKSIESQSNESFLRGSNLRTSAWFFTKSFKSLSLLWRCKLDRMWKFLLILQSMSSSLVIIMGIALRRISQILMLWIQSISIRKILRTFSSWITSIRWRFIMLAKANFWWTWILIKSLQMSTPSSTKTIFAPQNPFLWARQESINA